MTASVTSTGVLPSTGSARLLGLRPLARKDFGAWRTGRRPWIILTIATLLLAGKAVSAWITDWIIRNAPAGPGETPPHALPLDPLTNLLGAAATSFTVVVAIFATMGLLAVEREAGTLAWTLSKPVSRTSVLVSSWLTAAVALWVTSIVVPLAAVAGLVALLYGVPPLAAVIVLALGLGATSALYVAIAIASATVVPSQAGVAAIGLTVLFAAPLLGGLMPSVAPFLPTSIIGWTIELAAGAPVTLVTPVAWFVGLVAILALARALFAKAEV